MNDKEKIGCGCAVVIAFVFLTLCGVFGNEVYNATRTTIRIITAFVVIGLAALILIGSFRDRF